MSKIELWTIPDCPCCEEVKAVLATAGMAYTERSMDSLRQGEILDVDAMAHLIMTDGQAPMIRRDGRFINESEFLSEAST